MINSIRTARQAAIHLIKGSVAEGISFESLKASFLDNSCAHYTASIGGYIKGKWISSKFIVVSVLQGHAIMPKIFELKELYCFLKEEHEISSNSD